MSDMINQTLSNILYEYGMVSAEHAVLAEDVAREHHERDVLHDEPVIQFVNQLLNDAWQQRVSDIHFEMTAQACRVRFRKDGLLHEHVLLPLHFANRVMTRIKILANLDITEKRLPQDGRLVLQVKPMMDCRVSTCPGLHGEKIVLRLLRHHTQQLALHELGMSIEQLQQFQHALAEPQGLILVTGPTGSGKTATLYSALQTLNTPDKNIVTVEDPVEIAMNGITQVNTHPRIGLTFASVLRAFLRQDPDIMMIGEIRDAETAAIAVQAAQTGHLVLSTLHTNHAMDTLKRLLALGIELPQLAGSLKLLAAQRLVRKISSHANYEGRTGIFEIVPISVKTSQLLLARSSLAAIEKQMKAENNMTLTTHGLTKVDSSITTKMELARVLGSQY